MEIAYMSGIKFDYDDFQAISDRTPLLSNLSPNGNFMMHDLYEGGGMKAVLVMLDDYKGPNGERLIHRDCLTATGKTMGENIDMYRGGSKKKKHRCHKRTVSRRSTNGPSSRYTKNGFFRNKNIQW